MALPFYFERALQIAKIFGQGDMVQPTLANADQWLERIENELSPENLTCDGELRGTGLRTKYRELKAAETYLLLMKGITPTRPTKTMRPPVTPIHNVGDVVTFRGQPYTIQKVKKVNYEVLAQNGRRYNLRFGAV